MAPQTHVIGRQVLEISFESERDAFSLQQEVAELFQTRVVPAMDALFDRCAPAEAVLRLDRVEIDFGRLPRKSLDETFATRVCEALEARLTTDLNASSMAPQEETRAEARTEATSEAAEVRLSHDEHVLALWHFVLLHGYLPWWAPPASAARLEARVSEALQPLDKLPPSTERLLREHDVVTERLARQGSEALLEHLLRLATVSLAAVSGPVIASLPRLIESAPIEALRADVFRRHLWRAVLEESVQITALDPKARLRRWLRAALGESARNASMPYRELLSQLRARLESAEVRSAPALPAETREEILAALADPRVAEDESGTRPKQAAPEALERPGEETIEAGQREPPEEATRAESPRVPKVEGLERPDGPIEAGQRELPEREVRAIDALRPHDAIVHSVDDDARAIERIEAAPEAAGLVKSLARDASTLRDPSRSPVETRHDTTLSEGDVLFVGDAGIVLLNPFLAPHFEKLGLLRDGVFLDDDTRERAVHQLHYLATGEQDAPEPLLAFAKILCGLTPDVPIGRSAPLDERAKSEADVLLKEVIRHWGALKNASPDGLRETFLRRGGRLERKDDGWKLRVESLGYDVLLDRLPWSLSVIRQPWTADLIFVEWGS